MKISVITVCYNHVKYIEDCLRSVLDQDYPALEYIVIDGASTDGSPEIIQRYSSRLAYWVSEPDSGQTDALAKGFRHSTGEILCWINSDDQLEPGSLKRVADFFAANPEADVLTGDHIKMSEDGTPIELHRDLPFNAFLWHYTYNYTAQTSTFWRRKLYDDAGGMDLRFNVGMDSDLFARFGERANWHKTRDVLSRFRLHKQQKTQTLLQRMHDENRIVLERYQGGYSPARTFLCRAIARPIRISWRLLTGCYWAKLPPDMRRPLYQ